MPDKANKQPGKLYRAADFAFSLRSWKRTFTVPFKRMGRYVGHTKDSAKTIYHQHDKIEPANSKEELLLAIKKSKSSAIVNLIFAVAMAAFIVSTNTKLYQGLVCSVILLMFVFRFAVDALINIRAKEQLSSGRFK